MAIHPHVARIESHMYKSWIIANPELALERVERFCREAKDNGMRLRYVESEHYVDIIAAFEDKYLEGDHA